MEARALSSDVNAADGIVSVPPTPTVTPLAPFGAGASDQPKDVSYLETRVRVLTSELDEKQLRVDVLAEVCRAAELEKIASVVDPLVIASKMRPSVLNFIMICIDGC